VQLALAEDFFMVDDRPAESPQVENLGWRVTLAGLGINLALGILYTWSVISKRVPDDWQWSQADKSWPYSIACLVFCLVMVPAGRMQRSVRTTNCGDDGRRAGGPGNGVG
jgi:hypothetical protein